MRRLEGVNGRVSTKFPPLQTQCSNDPLENLETSHLGIAGTPVDGFFIASFAQALKPERGWGAQTSK